jgi:hypothetical protein
MSTGSTLDTMDCASSTGAGFGVTGRKDGGSNWTTSKLARVSQTDVRCLCDAKQTNSNIGPAGNERSVVSVGREVIDLKKSLNA